MERRQHIRQKYLAKRNQLTTESCHQHGHTVRDHIVKQQFFIEAQHLAFYMACCNELPLQPLIQASWQLGKNCYLPVLSYQNQPMRFHLYQPSDELTRNRYKILEPLVHTKCIATEALDVVFLPLVAWDKHGHRLGMGAGYYDKCFSFLSHQAQHIKPYMVGVAHEIQYHERIPAMPWDIPLQAVVTEKTIYTF